MTKEEAIALYKTEFWSSMTAEEIATFQLFEEKLCLPLDVFHEALEKTLGRPVWTHEFACDLNGLKMELLGERNAPTPEEIINLIPEEKRLLIIPPASAGHY